MLPILFQASLEKAGPKHSTRVPASVVIAVPLSVDEKEVAFIPNPGPEVALKVLPDPQGTGRLGVLCARTHSPLPPTLQRVTPSLSPVTVHLKVKLSPGHVGGAAVNCPATSPGEAKLLYAGFRVLHARLCYYRNTTHNESYF